MFFVASFAAISSFALASAAVGPVTDLHIVNADLPLDGFPRGGVYAEGQFPGPLITGNKGDSFSLNVINELKDESMLKSTSIHWHGLFQKGTNYADGVASINQCPIAPGASFEYNFAVPGQAGTFWYHSHLSTQYCDGLRGPMVVYDPVDPHFGLYDVDNEDTIITLADWYHIIAPLAPAVPKMDSTLINGAGRYKGGPSNDLAVVNVVQGMRYRMRLVSMSCAPNWVFSIQGHALTIIEADGENTKPHTVDSIQIFAGQRYSFVLNANQTIDNYWIHANPNEGTAGFEGGLNSAILRYSTAPIAEPAYVDASAVVSHNPLVETDLHALSVPDTGVPGAPYVDGADVDINLAMSYNATTGKFSVNGASFESPPVPVLLQMMSKTYTPQSLLPSGSVYELPLNKSIQLSLPPGNAVGAPHPFHMHGHSFDVVRSAGSDVYNYDDPVRRDVVSTGTAGDNVTIRFRTDNAGPWFLHCHIDWHLATGLAVVLAEDTNGQAAIDNTPPPAWDALCPAYDALTPSELGGIVPTIVSSLPPSSASAPSGPVSSSAFSSASSSIFSSASSSVFSLAPSSSAPTSSYPSSTLTASGTESSS